MRVLTVIDEDFTNYKVPSMFIGTVSCGGKCCIEAGIPLSVCHNDGWRNRAPVQMSDDDIIKRYINNNITSAICFAGLEPFEQFDEMFELIKKLRTEYHRDDVAIIYTGFNKNEILPQVKALKQFKNIVIKYGRFLVGHDKHFDDVLGVDLASDNQYAEVIS